MSRLRTNIITNRMANGAPTVSNGLVISGVTTTSEILVGNLIKLDPVSGVVTARAVDIDDFLDVGSNIKLGNAGVITATSFSGSGANLTSIPAAQLTGTLPALDGSNLTNVSAGKLLQVVQQYDTSFSRAQITSTTYTATAFSVTITPTAAGSKIMLNFSGISNNDGAGQAVNMAIYRSIAGGSFAQFTPSGSNDPGRIGMNKGDQSRNEISFNIQYYDTPSYTLGDAIIYKLYARSVTGHKIEIPSSPQGAPVLCIAQEIA